MRVISIEPQRQLNRQVAFSTGGLADAKLACKIKLFLLQRDTNV
jgi:hypothetical protein